MGLAIAFIGFMGSGKSVLGSLISEQEQVNFLETDQIIEKEAGLSITEIFEQYGEDYFRNLERDILYRDLSQSKNLILSTGGGLPCYKDNMDLLKKKYKTIYLKISAENLTTRLINKRQNRPLLAKLSEAELFDFISGKLYERSPFYEQSDIIVTLDNRNKKDNARYLRQIIKSEGLFQ